MVPEKLAFEKRHGRPGRAGSRTKSSNMFVKRNSLRNDVFPQSQLDFFTSFSRKRKNFDWNPTCNRFLKSKNILSEYSEKIVFSPISVNFPI